MTQTFKQALEAADKAHDHLMRMRRHHGVWPDGSPIREREKALKPWR